MILAGLWSGVAAAEDTNWTDRLALSGYGEVRTSWTDAAGDEPWQLAERLRPTARLDASRRWHLTVTPEASLTQGRYEPAAFADVLDEQFHRYGSSLDQVEEQLGCSIDTERHIDEVSDVLTLERLYLDVEQPALDLRVGRQAVNWGSALFLNPTDVFAEVLLQQPWRERRGVDAVRLTVPWGELDEVQVVAGTDQTSERWGDAPGTTTFKVGVRPRVHVGTTDIAAVGFAERTLDGQADQPLGLRRSVAGLDVKGDLPPALGGAGAWIEASWDGDLRASTGLDWSVPVGNNLYLAGQLTFDGSGATPDDYDWTARTATYAPAGLSECVLPGGTTLTSTSAPRIWPTLGRWYGLVDARWAIDDEWTVWAVGVMNLADGTGIALPGASWTPSGRLALNAMVELFVGKEGEFHPGPSATTIEMPGITLDLSSITPRWVATVWARESF